MEPSSKEDAQRLWQMEKQRMQDTLRKQKQQMMEDNKWLEKEERLLVGNTTLTLVHPLPYPQCSFLDLSLALGAVRKRGSMSMFFQMNLPVPFQDPMGQEGETRPVVGVCLSVCLT